MTDCYWSKKDNYAAWIWNQLNHVQREELISKVNFMYSYAEFLCDQQAEPGTDHLHPTYMKPIDLALYSNDELKTYLKKQPSLWNHLGPIRKLDFEMPFKERFALENLSAIEKNKTPQLPPSKDKVFRLFPVKLEGVQLSIEDENYLLENSKMIPNEQKQYLSSLIWLSMCAKESQEKILAKYSASQLAQVWIGPETTLNQLEAALPEAKFTMLKEYLAKTTPQRKNPTMSQLTLEAIQALEAELVHENKAA